jgi:hypothetical protein
MFAATAALSCVRLMPKFFNLFLGLGILLMVLQVLLGLTFMFGMVIPHSFLVVWCLGLLLELTFLVMTLAMMLVLGSLLAMLKVCKV